ncbi:hypothetical protein O3M35_010502 [Rhynocoris fuscipes]|uniref:Ketosynthase family 3 (KS3) domain-containing protein n=1 Tax=Rhynocoris fuscipes TaxID=488301 RepID=A0AAW1D0J9_9HEMI
MSSEKIEVVISGIAGIFPACDNFEELEQKLLNKEDMINYNSPKWPEGTYNISSALGVLKKNIAMDIQFFNILHSFYRVMDPVTVQGIKGSFEAICDAGINPNKLAGSKTAVVMSSYVNELEQTYITSERNLAIVGQNKAMQANRVSFCLDFKGPSFVIDAALNGGAFALRAAYDLIASGECPAAIVTSVNPIYGPEFSFFANALGRLNGDGKTKCFSADADGYTRSEGAVAFFLQRAQDAKRSYGTIKGVYANENGSRTVSFTEVCPQMYKNVLEETYRRAQIDPSQVAYVEADGHASKKMDATELNTIAEVMCKNRKTPLYVGSVKSNLGHTEASSFLISVAKALVALKHGIIPPNLHYSQPNPDVPALLSGQLKVVTEPTPLNGNIVAVSNINTSGCYGHVVIEGNPKTKNQKEPSTIPWLFIISGRKEDSLEAVIKKVEGMPFDEDFVKLTYDVFQTQIKGHIYRGFTLLNCGDKIDKEQQTREIKHCLVEKKPVWFMFSGMGSQWNKMGADLMVLPTFAKTIFKCHEILLPKGVDLLTIITSPDPEMFNSILHSFVGIAAIQIALVDVLKELGIEPDGIIGHSVGELGCAYADGCLTAEQTILAAYARGRASIEVDLITGMMAAVGNGYKQMKDELPPTIEVACHNSAKSCTLSGPAEDMQKYVASIKEKGIFAKLVNVANIAYHSRYIKPAAPILLKYLKQIIPEPKERSKRWISTSIPESSWNSDLAKFCSAEYHTNNLLSSVLFEEASVHIPDDCILIEIAPHGLLQSIVKESLKGCINIPMTSRYAKDNLIYLLRAIGKLYVEGIDINIDRLYPKAEYPVPISTPCLQPLLTWDEKEGLGNHKCQFKGPGSETYITVKELENYFGYKIGDKQLISSTALLGQVLDLFKMDNDIDKNLVFIRDLKFNKPLEYSKELESDLCTQLLKGSGIFAIFLEKSIFLTGIISSELYSTKLKEAETEENHMNPVLLEMNNQELYKHLEKFSVKIPDSYKLIQNFSLNNAGVKARVTWKGNWFEFIDALLMVVSMCDTLLNNEFCMVHYVREISIDFSHLNNLPQKEMLISYNKCTNEVITEGIRLHKLETSKCKVTPSLPKLAIKTCQFLPYYSHINNKYYGDIEDCLNLVFQNALPAENDDSKVIIILDDTGSIAKHINDSVTDYCNSNDLRVDIITSPSEDTMEDVYYSLRKKDSLFIVGEVPFHKRAMKCLEIVKAGFILLKNTSSTNIWNPIHPMLKLEDKSFTLHKACYTEGMCLNYVNMDNSINWQSELTSVLNDAAVKTNGAANNVYLVGKVKTLYEIFKITKLCKELQNSHLLRFIFMDENAPPFTPNHPFYKNQIALDLVINISITNQWGVYKLSVPTNKISPTKLSLNEEVKTVYPLSSIKGETVSLSTIGLNLSASEKHPETQELRIVEYCGENIDGKKVFGIGILTDDQWLHEDNILNWEKPSSWSDESAVSVPLYYSLAYYIVRELYKLPAFYSNYQTILVHRGAMQVSQAIINVALAEGLEVITTYKTDQEKNQIRKLFPKINESNILHPKSVARVVSDLTNGWGVDIGINPIQDNSFLETLLRSTARHGQLYQITEETPNDDFAVGMGFFGKSCTLHFLPINIITAWKSEDKEVVQKEVEKGIKSGHVKPLKSSMIPVTSLNFEAEHMLKEI